MEASLVASLASDQIQEDFGQQEQEEPSTNGKKRKSDDGSQPGQRAKRNRYISIACNEV